MTKKISLIFILCICIVLSLWPLSTNRWFFTHDFVHGARIAEYARGLVDGQLPVIWSKNFGYGYGMPLFLFYAPLPYLIGAVFYLIGFDLVVIMRLLYLLATVVGGLGAFLVVKKIFGFNSGLLAALIYSLAPYRALNLYVRGAVSESFGLALAPFVLWGVMLIWHKKWYGVPILAVFLCLVALSHNLSLMLILPVTVSFAVYLFAESVWINRSENYSTSLTKLGQAMLGLGLGLGMAVFYLVPAAVYQSLTKLEQIVLSGYSDYRHHFLYLRQFLDNNWGYGGSGWGPDDSMSFFLGYAPLFGLGFVIGHFLIKSLKMIWNQKIEYNQNYTRLWFFALVTLGCLIFTTPKLNLIWQNVSIMRVLQFPWRFLGPATLAVTILSSGVLSLVVKCWQKILWLLIAGLTILTTGYFRPQGYLMSNQDLYYDSPRRIATEMSGILPDYIPKALPEQISPADTPIWHLPVSSNLQAVKRWDSRSLILEINTQQSELMIFSVAYFPGWRAEVNSKAVEIIPSQIGLIGLTLEPGDNLIELSYHSTTLQRLTWGVSGLSVLLLLVVSYHNYKQSHHNYKQSYGKFS